MSKTQLRKYLQGLSQAQVSEILLDVYSARKQAKEYLDFFLNPDSRKKGEEFRRKLEREFVSRDMRLKRHPRRSVCKRLISDFKSFQPDPEELAALMLHYARLTGRHSRLLPSAVPEPFLKSAADVLIDAINLLAGCGSLPALRKDVEETIAATSGWGYGHHDRIVEALADADYKTRMSDATHKS